MTPVLSIIVPVYNTEMYLEQCIWSILKQSYREFELVLVDDGSTDKSGLICDHLALSDDRIIVIHKENEGQSSARNEGLKVAKGKYLSFIDSDDWIDEYTFESCIKVLDNDSDISFVQYPYEKESYFHKYPQRIVSDKNEIFRLWLENRTLTNYVCDKIFRSSLFTDVKFPEGAIFEDRFIFAPLLLSCNSIYLLQSGKYYYRTHAGQTVQRSHTPFFLKSMICADINILANMPSGLNDLYVKVYWRIFCNFLEYAVKVGNRRQLQLLLKQYSPSIMDFDRRTPFGIKLHLLAVKLLGVRLYLLMKGIK